MSDQTRPAHTPPDQTLRDRVRTRLQAWLRAGLHHPLTSLAGKSAVAAGVAFWLGGLLPGELAQYRYYAALGAFSVIYPALADSVRESARAVSAIVAGVALAVAVQLVSWTHPLSIAVAVGAGVAVGGIPWFREQRSWIPVAALFVLTVGGSNPETYVIGYVTQLALGAVVGLVVNFALFAPLPVHELESAAVALRKELVVQLRSVGTALEDGGQPSEDEVLDALPRLTPARDRMQRAVDEARRARRGNPRAARATPVHRALFDLGQALDRSSASVEAVAVAMLDRDPQTEVGPDIRLGTAHALEALAAVLDSPRDVGSELVTRAEDRIEALLDTVDAQHFERRETRYVAGAAAVASRRCLTAFVAAYRRSGPTATLGPPGD